MVYCCVWLNKFYVLVVCGMVIPVNGSIILHNGIVHNRSLDYIRIPPGNFTIQCDTGYHVIGKNDAFVTKKCVPLEDGVSTKIVTLGNGVFDEFQDEINGYCIRKFVIL